MQAKSDGCPALPNDTAALHIGTVAFIHRFGSSMNEPVHFHVGVVDGVFEEVAGNADGKSCPSSVTFLPADGMDAASVAQVEPDWDRVGNRHRTTRSISASIGQRESCDSDALRGSATCATGRTPFGNPACHQSPRHLRQQGCTSRIFIPQTCATLGLIRLNFLSLISAIIWMGGMTFMLFALRPSVLAVLEPRPRSRLMA